ncbi:MAG: hypothetical protein V4708_17590, partial [Bacteroidota bacterium]
MGKHHFEDLMCRVCDEYAEEGDECAMCDCWVCCDCSKEETMVVILEKLTRCKGKLGLTDPKDVQDQDLPTRKICKFCDVKNPPDYRKRAVIRALERLKEVVNELP